MSDLQPSTPDAWAPLRVELPLNGLEAFRLASFDIEYVPQYADIQLDQYFDANFRIRPKFFNGRPFLQARRQ